MTPKQLKASILQLAIQGKLVPQDPNDEPASELLKRIVAERERQIAEKKIKKPKPLPLITDAEKPFPIPASWEWVRLGEIVSLMSGVSYDKKDVGHGSVRVLRGGNIKDNFTLSFREDDVFLPQKYEDPDSVLKEHDIVVVGSTGSSTVIGRPAIVTKKDEGAQIGAFLRIIRPTLYSAKWVHDIFRSEFYREHIREVSRGTNIKNLKREYVTEFAIPLPPLAEQKRIVAKIEALFKYVDECEDSRKELAEKLAETLKRSVLQEAIQGQLVPQDPNDEPASELLKRIAAERERQIAEKKIKKPKPLPPITDAEKPFPIPDSWEWVRLGEIISLLSGRDLEPNEYSAVPKKYPYMTGASNFGENGLVINRWTEKAVPISHKNELLITCKGTIGTMAFNTIGDIHIARQIMSLSSAWVDLRFVKVFLGTVLVTLQSAANSMIPGISRDTLLILSFPLPPLAEQKRIVAKVEALLASVAKLKE